MATQRIDVEQSLLSAMLFDKAAKKQGLVLLKPEHFSWDHHKMLMDGLVKSGLDGCFYEAARQTGEYSAFVDYLHELINAYRPTYSHDFKRMAWLLRQDAAKDSLGELMAGVDPNGDVLEQVSGVEDALVEIKNSIIVEQDRSWNQVLDEAYEQLVSPEKHPLIKTGFNKLDSLIGGVSLGELVIVGARPSMGKSLFAGALMRNEAKLSGKNVLLISLEMPDVSFAKRLIKAEAGGWHKETLINGVAGLYDLPITIKSNVRFNVSAVDLAIEQAKQDNPELRLVIIDYLQLVDVDNRKGSRNDEVSVITRRLKQLTLEKNISIIALSQLSRGVESREDKRPKLADLRDSGSIEQDADQVWFLYREGYYQDPKTNIGKLEVLVGKNRNGRLGTATLWVDLNLQQITDFESDNERLP